MVDPETIFKKTRLAIAVSAIVAQPAFAAQMEEIVVSATRHNEKVTDVPYNITALTGDTLSKDDITNFTTLARSVPGLTFTETGPRGSGLNSGLIIRGLNVSTSGSTDLLSVAQPTVSTYVGETPMFVNLELKDIKRVEILRGPQGTLYGSGSLGGTIRYIPNKPDLSRSYATISSRVGNTNHASGLNTDTYGVVNLALSDKLGMRIVAGYVENKGYVDVKNLVTFNSQGHILAADGSDPIANGIYAGVENSGTGPGGTYLVDVAPGGHGKFTPLFHTKANANGNSIKHARVMLEWDISDSTKATVTYQYQHDIADARQAANPVDSGKFSYNSAVLEKLERRVDLYALDLESDLGFATLNFSASRYENNASYISDQTPIYTSNTFFAYGYVNAPFDVAYGHYKQSDKGTTAELRLVSNTTGKFDYVAGAYWLDQKYSALQRDIMPGAYDFIPAFYGDPPGSWGNSSDKGFFKDQVFDQNVAPEFKNKAIYGELTWHITDKWQVTGGLRFFDQKFDITNDLFLLGCGTYCDAPNTPPQYVGTGYNVNTSSQTFQDHISKFNTSYHLSDDLMVYFTRSEGFRHGGVNALDNNPSSPLYDNPDQKFYKSDLATNLEVGLKGQILNGQLSFSTALYHILWKNMQFITFSDGSAVPIIQNASEARSQGIELDANYNVTDSFSTRLGFTYVDAKLTKDFSRPNVQGKAGDRLPGVPALSANLGLQYTQFLGGGKELSYNLGANFIGKIQTDFNKAGPNYTESGGYTLADFSVDYSTSSYDVTLFVNNLTDKQAYSNGRSPNQYAQFPYLDPSSPTSVNVIAPYERHGYYLEWNLNRPRTVGVGFTYHFSRR